MQVIQSIINLLNKTVYPACPYCGLILSATPARKKKCGQCKNPIIVRKQGDKKLLLTEQQAVTYDRKKRDEREKQKKITRDRVKRETELMMKDAIKAKDPQKLRQGYITLAQIYQAEGDSESSFKAQQMSSECELRIKQETGIRKVKVSSAGDERVCEACRELDGKIISVTQALKTMPLPPNNCKFCRCVYLACIET